MSELVLLHHNEPMTTSETIADGVDLPHKSVIQLIRKYVKDLQEWGEVAFQMRLNQQGSPTEVAWLNEGQSMFLLTLMRNSPVVVAFKKALVKAFLELRDRLTSPPPTFQTLNPSHGADLVVSADRTFRGFLRAARSAGLRPPAALRVANEQTRIRTGMDMLAELGAEDLAERPGFRPGDPNGVIAFAAAWLSGELPLPATVCKSADLYAAYAHWRAKVSPGGTAPINDFGPSLTHADARLVKRHVWARLGGRDMNVRAIVPNGDPPPFGPGALAIYHGIEIERFAAALMRWKEEG